MARLWSLSKCSSDFHITIKHLSHWNGNDRLSSNKKKSQFSAYSRLKNYDQRAQQMAALLRPQHGKNHAKIWEWHYSIRIRVHKSGKLQNGSRNNAYGSSFSAICLKELTLTILLGASGIINKKCSGTVICFNFAFRWFKTFLGKIFRHEFNKRKAATKMIHCRGIKSKKITHILTIGSSLYPDLWPIWPPKHLQNI